LVYLNIGTFEYQSIMYETLDSRANIPC